MRSSLVVQMASQHADMRTIREPPYSKPTRQSALPIQAFLTAAAINSKRLAAAIAGLLLR